MKGKQDGGSSLDGFKHIWKGQEQGGCSGPFESGARAGHLGMAGPGASHLSVGGGAAPSVQAAKGTQRRYPELMSL